MYVRKQYLFLKLSITSSLRKFNSVIYFKHNEAIQQVSKLYLSSKINLV